MNIDTNINTACPLHDRSTPVTKQTLQKQFPDLFALDDTSSSFDRKTEGDTLVDIEGDIRACEVGHPEEAGKLKNALLAATDYMSHFRADNIVKDAEVVKDSLLLVPEDDDDEDDEVSLRESILFLFVCVSSITTSSLSDD